MSHAVDQVGGIEEGGKEEEKWCRKISSKKGKEDDRDTKLCNDRTKKTAQRKEKWIRNEESKRGQEVKWPEGLDGDWMGRG